MDTAQATRPDEGPFNAHAQRHHSHRGWNVKRRKVAARDHHIRSNHTLSEARERKFISTPPLMQFMKSMPLLLVTLLTLKYQGKTERDLFQENPAPVWCFIAATCVYWLTVGTMKQMTCIKAKCFQIFIHTAVASGNLSALSMVSIFLTYPVSLLPLLIWIPLPVVLAWPKAYNLFDRGIKGAIGKIHAIAVWATGCNSVEEASLPV